MFNRLKTLPLTIILTILVWMYAEAQFTSTRDDVRLSIRIASPSPDLSIRAVDSHGNSTGPVAMVTVSLQGPKSQIDNIFKESLGSGGAAQSSSDDDLATLTYTPPLKKLQPTDGAAPTDVNTIDTVAMLNSLPYFRRHDVIVSSANPITIRLEVDTFDRLTKTPDFRPAVAFDSFTLNPEQVTVNVPTHLLEDIGGADKFTVTAVPQRDLATLPPDTDQTVPVRFVLDYPATRDERITVTPSQGTVSIHIPKRQGITQTIPDVPVFVSGPPNLLSRFDIDLRPKNVRITVAGSTAAIQALRQRLVSSTPHNIYACLDLTADDRPTPAPVTRRLRYILPEGLTLQDAPADAEFRLLEPPVPPASQPATIPR